MAIIDNTLAAQIPTFDPATPLMHAAQIQKEQAGAQEAQFKQNQTEMGAEMRGVAPFVNTPEFPQKWAQAADRLRQRGVIDDQMHEQWANSPSPLLMKSIIAKTEDPALSFQKSEAERSQGNTDRSFGLQKTQADRSYGLAKRASDREDDPTPDNFEANPDFGKVPGAPKYAGIGPNDPSYLAQVAKQTAMAKGEVPTVMGAGSAVVIPNKASEGAIFTNKPTGGDMSDTAIEMKARQLAGGDLSALTNVGRGAQGSAILAKISNKAAEILVDENGMSPTEAASHMSQKLQEFKAAGIGKSTEARTSASREANLNLILKATEAAIPAALEASDALPRTGWVPVNKLIQKGEVSASSPELKKFAMANLQLAEHWARAMNPTGVMRESDRDMALGILSIADSKDTYKQAVMQLKTQITRERDAVRGVTGGATQFPPSPAGGAPAAAPTSQGSSGDSLLARAKLAIGMGADREKVLGRLKDAGVDTSGL